MDALKNFSYSTVATAPSPASSGTSLVLASGEGALFPDPSTAGSYNITIWPVNTQPTAANAEIARVTARSTDTLTITRAQEGSSARSVTVGDQVALTVTAKTLTDLRIGGSELVYRYTVTGSDKASIDTTSDTADAGSNDWTNCDLLEVFLYSRTDEAVFGSGVGITLNNDTTSGHYAYQWARVDGTTSAYSLSASTTAVAVQVPGTSITDTTIFGVVDLKIPNPTGTVGEKSVVGQWQHQSPGNTGNMQVAPINAIWLSTAAITRIAFTPSTSGKKFKVGTQVLIYKRRSV